MSTNMMMPPDGLEQQQQQQQQLATEICRLCLRVTADQVPCFGGSVSTVADILIKHFWIELHRNRDAAAYICHQCWSKVDAFHQFYSAVLQLHQTRLALKPESEAHDAVGLRLDEKLEITMSVEQTVLASGADDEALHGEDDIKEEEAHDDYTRDDASTTDADDAEDADYGGAHRAPQQQDVPKRKRGRPRNQYRPYQPHQPDSESEQPQPIDRVRGGRSHKSAASAAAASIKLESAGDQQHSDSEFASAAAASHNDSAAAAETSTAADPFGDELDPATLAQFFTLQCDICSEALPSLQVARHHHQQVHKQRGYLVCGCGKSFVRNASIREHCAFHADASQWKCVKCCKIFAGSRRLAAHQRAFHADGEDVVKAEATAAVAATSADGDAGAGGTEQPAARRNSKHQQQLDDELMRKYVPMVCGLCGVGYETFGQAKKHFAAAHDEEGYVECCGRRYMKKSRAVLHCRWHENPKLFDCTFCGRNFSGKVVLREHIIRKHPNNAPYSYQCDDCPDNFKLYHQLRSHRRAAHPQPDDKRFECFICHREFLFIDRLRNHVRCVHDDVPSHICDVCARYFKTKATYDLHYALEHSNVSLKCQCPECGKWLKHHGMLNRHMAYHRSVPQTCTECGHVSSSQRGLNSHKRLVHSDPRHKCLVCEKMFKSTQTLREHMAMHAGITDLYTCAYCPKTFRSNANMYKHRRQVHAAQFEVDRRAAKLASDERNAAEAAAAAAAGDVKPRDAVTSYW